MEIVFSSERLVFRKFTEDDAGLIYTLNSNPEVTKYVHEVPTTPEIALSILKDNILQQYKLNGHGRWALHLKTTNEFIGWCGLKFRPEMNTTDLGYRLMQKFWGLSYATEAARRTIEFGFETRRLQEIFAAAHIENIASQKVLEKCGMHFVDFSTVDGCPVKTYKIFAKLI